MVKRKLNHLDVLEFIGDEPRQTPALIAKKFGISVSSTRNMMTILHGLGLVRRVGRGVYALTDIGLQVLVEGKAVVQQICKKDD